MATFGFIDPEFGGQGLIDPEANKTGLIDPELTSTAAAAAAGQVPFRSMAVVMATTLTILAASDANATLAKPNAERVKIAPLTLAYGQQPPSPNPQRQSYFQVVSSWPPDLEPRLQAPNERQQHIIPLTLAYGSQPTPTAPLTLQERQTVDAWPKEDWPAQRSKVSVIPSLVFGDQPIPAAALTVQERQAVDAWPKEDWPAQRSKVSSIPATLVYGDQPIPGPLTAPERQIIDAQRESWDAQTRPKSLAWSQEVAPLPYPSAPYNQRILNTWQSEQTQLPRPVQIAPLTLTYGDLPAPSSSLSSQDRQTIDAWPQESWSSQRSVLSTAAWTTIPSWQPFVPFQYRTVLSNWPSEEEQRPHIRNLTAPRVVALTLTYGNQPVPTSPLSLQERQSIDAWPQENWASQRATISYAAWFAPPAWQTFVPFQYRTILVSWPADLEPQPARVNLIRPKTVALTFPRVDQPPLRRPLSSMDMAIVFLNQILAANPNVKTSPLPPTGAGGVTLVQLERGIRGVMRGVAHGG